MDENCDVTSKPGSFKEFFRSSGFWKSFLSIVIGGLAGFLFFYFVGCKSGSCAITSNPYGSIITGGLLGYLLTGSPAKKCNP